MSCVLCTVFYLPGLHRNDPALFLSKATGRGGLHPGWIDDESVAPKMCCYKAVRASESALPGRIGLRCILRSNFCRPLAVFKYFALQGTVEGAIAADETRLLGKSLGHAFCAMDHWYPLNMEAVRAMERVRGLGCTERHSASLASCLTEDRGQARRRFRARATAQDGHVTSGSRHRVPSHSRSQRETPTSACGK